MSSSYVCVGSHSSRSLLSKVWSLRATGLGGFFKDVFASSSDVNNSHTHTHKHTHHGLFSLLAYGGGGSAASPPGSVIASSSSLQTPELMTGLCCTFTYHLIPVIFLRRVAFSLCVLFLFLSFLLQTAIADVFYFIPLHLSLFINIYLCLSLVSCSLHQVSATSVYILSSKSSKDTVWGLSQLPLGDSGSHRGSVAVSWLGQHTTPEDTLNEPVPPKYMCLALMKEAGEAREPRQTQGEHARNSPHPQATRDWATSLLFYFTEEI